MTTYAEFSHDLSERLYRTLDEYLALASDSRKADMTMEVNPRWGDCDCTVGFWLTGEKRTNSEGRIEYKIDTSKELDWRPCEQHLDTTINVKWKDDFVEVNFS